MEYSENKPIYLQLADQIMDQVERDPQLNGARIPSVREYAAKAGVNANTVMRTYNWLTQENIIYNQRGIGYFMCEDAHDKVLDMRRRYFADQELPYFLDRLHAFGYTPDEIKKIYEEFLSHKDS